ncbi:MAG: gamma-glutamyltransferase family protein [Rhodospirillaceae bacterium]|jgi:oxamate amidohydrolase|nr:gamma-glutamyltransferase family protein [Rhodospirillaceae bacterium]MBT5245590.1 gamma-glutamyltransferase family protein [Rhodospirillaceae bacterium]MBT5561162.1 gamma-glutamyltransferase family protein [Rhodospirillaceae bacterium]MBT6242856.1 gamma-glutamyltransferase family protein [Rhodospirillaceae bacterium]MBT7136335.1 gamma-glutamyltransferase family protein [Rhodospirillaceae bacterium]
MIFTKHGRSGMMSAPHHLAAEAGANILRAGGNAVEAMVAAAATIAVVYPHMNSIGGDGFWIISEPGKEPIGIDACGPAAALATVDAYKRANCDSIPARGPLAALSVAGTLSGWASALDVASSWGTAIPLPDILADAVGHGRAGVSVTRGQEKLTGEKLAEVKAVPGFARTYLSDEGKVLEEGAILKQPALAATLERLGQAGLDDFYRGDVARALASGLENTGSFLRLSDLESYHALPVAPLSVGLDCGQIYNMPPPTQGVSALMILALFERLGVKQAESFDHIHGLVEATKQAFILRDAHVTDPACMNVDAAAWLQADFLDGRAANIDKANALPWPHVAKPGDTIWMGAADKSGRVVSFIQSTYWEYGSGVVVPDTGVVWQNRGMSFSLDPSHHNALEPGKRPFHTLIPALARLKDGRTMAYGNMGGEGQPQSQAAVFSRHVMFGAPLQEAISAPRWLLGRTWGEDTASLKLENRFDSALVDKLMAAGHDVELMEPFTSTMGHAGAVSVSHSGAFEGASDPRSDGAAVGL